MSAAFDLRACDNALAVADLLATDGYLADEGLATALHLALQLERPLLLEGEAGVGKTEIARTVARVSGARLIRVQCYEGIDAAQALYEWDYSRQLLHLRAAETAAAIAGDRTGAAVEDLEADLFTERFLIRRPLLQAVTPAPGPPPVLLIDEVDRADDEFEAFLLEMLSDYAVTIPELGTFTAAVAPIVILTSNRTRDVHDALKRRCLYHWVDHPDYEREVAIVEQRVPQASAAVSRQVAAMTQRFRELGLYKPPGVAETIDWATAMTTLRVEGLDADSVRATLGTVLKYREDQERVIESGLAGLVREALDRVGAL